MVKKTSFFEKLKGRWRTSSVQVETGRGEATAASADPTMARIEPVPQQVAESRIPGRKLSGREEGVVAIHEGFAELANLMRGVQARLEVQGERMASAAESLRDLPSVENAQLEALRKIAGRLEALDAVPETLQEMRAALERATAMDERSTKTLEEFQARMQDVQSSMNEMVGRATEQAQATSSLARAQREHIDGFTRNMREERDQQSAEVSRMVSHLGATAEQGIESLREAQEDQSTRLGKLVEDGTKTSRAILILLACTFAGLVLLTAVLIAG